MSRTIVVSAGHGAGDTGAPGPGGPDYPFTEADLTLELRDLVAQRLERGGYRVLRDGKEGESLSRSHSRSLVSRADVALDIHFNAPGKGGGGEGVECFGLAPEQALCCSLAGRVATALGLKLRGRSGYKHPSESQHPALGFCDAGGVLLEVCFMTRRDLDAYLPRKAQVAAAIAEALVEHLSSTENQGAWQARPLKNDRKVKGVRLRGDRRAP